VKPSALERAEACRASGDLQGGLAAAREAADQASDNEQRSRALWLQAHFLYRLGQLASVLVITAEHRELLKARGGQDWADHLRLTALAACDLGRFDIAVPDSLELYALAEADGRTIQRAHALSTMGACFERMGDPWQAERLMRESLALTRAAGTPRDCFVILNNLCAVLIGAFYLLRGESVSDEAGAALERALPLAREMHQLLAGLNEAYARVIATGNLGEILLHLGHSDEARQLLESALAEARQLGLTPQAQRVRCTLAEWQLQQGRPAPARDDLLDLLAEGPLMPLTRLRAHHALYLSARLLGDTPLALKHLELRTEIDRQRAVMQLRAQSEQLITRVEAERSRLEAERERERARSMEADALRDPLTGLGNRRAVAARLPTLLADAQALRHPLALVMLDLDHFKQVNDRFGHLVGDRVLETVARILREHLRGTDLVARTGGEEFLIVLPDAAPERAAEACERIRVHIQGHDWTALAPGLSVSVSVGLASAPAYDERALSARADIALYQAKARGRNRVEVA
jgi:diguanylate cyclase (GGDEF)-like protein